MKYKYFSKHRGSGYQLTMVALSVSLFFTFIFSLASAIPNDANNRIDFTYPQATIIEGANYSINTNYSLDSGRLGGQLPSYYARASDINSTFNQSLTDNIYVAYYDKTTQTVKEIKKIGSDFGTDYVDFEAGQIWNGGALILDWNYVGNGNVRMPLGWEVTDGFSFLSGVNSAGDFYASSVRADNSFNLANQIDNSLGPISIHADVFSDNALSFDAGGIYSDGMGTLTTTGLQVSGSVSFTDTYLNNIFETVGSTQVMDAPSRTLWSSSGQPENAVLDWSEDGKIKVLGNLEVYNKSELGVELIQNGDLTSSTGWTFGTGCAYDGVNDEIDCSGNNRGTANQTITFKPNTLYVVEFEIKNWVQGWPYLSLGGGEEVTGLNGNRVHRFIYKTDSNPNNVFSIRKETQGGSGIFSIDDVTVKEIVGGDGYTAGNMNVNRNITVGDLIKLQSTTLPSCTYSTKNVIGANTTGTFGCNSTTWVRLF